MIKKTTETVSKHSSKKHILIIDDDKDTLASVKGLLEDVGYTTVTANNGEKGLALLKKEKFDLVLLDVFMPGLGGLTVIKKIQQDPKLKNQKVAFLTVLKRDQTGLKMPSTVDYFEKPIEADNFTSRIKKILGDA
jgi:CheY-like chemotaxis protein